MKLNREHILLVIIIAFTSLLVIVTNRLIVSSGLKQLITMGGTVYILFLAFVLVFSISLQFKKRSYVSAGGEDILIIVPHFDDCVAVAGGFAIQTREQGGNITILYLTGGNGEEKHMRMHEAFNSWSMNDMTEKALICLDHDMYTAFTDRDEIDSCIEEIEDVIVNTKPGVIFIPLYEGGHYHHDITNYMVTQALKSYNLGVTVYEAPEYNFYFSWKTTPYKILSGLMRLVPFVEHNYPPEPISDSEVYYLKMTEEQLNLKKKMLSKFESQNAKRLIDRFGFEDRYQKLHSYDFSNPPFDYDHSIASRIQRLKEIPLISRPVSRIMKWTKTIHPDKNVYMTRIPD